MIVTIKKNTNKEQLQRLYDLLDTKGVSYNLVRGSNYDTLLLDGNLTTLDLSSIKVFDFVMTITRLTKSYKLASREYKNTDTVINVKGVNIGQDFCIIAGPCSISSYEEMDRIAKTCIDAGANVLRGGAFKMRTSPYSYQGMGVEGLKILHDIGMKYNIPVASEITSIEDIEEFEKYVDIIQVGARNMNNTALLEKLGKTNKPILLKRGMMSTLEELLLSAEYILKNGNPNVILCERGIKNFDKETRNTLDLGGALVLKEYSHLPVICDPSHATGKASLVSNIALGCIASGIDGLILEVHDDPASSRSDAMQAITPSELKELIVKAKQIREVIGK